MYSQFMMHGQKNIKLLLLDYSESQNSSVTTVTRLLS